MIVNYILDAGEFSSDQISISDFNGDGSVDILDIVALVSEILSGGDNPIGDLNGDGNVNILDVVILADIILN